MTKLEHIIYQQGKPIINDVWLVDKTDRIALAMIDMHSKYCGNNWFTGIETGANRISVPAMVITAPEHALHLNNDAIYDDTVIFFPSLAGYEVICASGGRYDIHVGFINFKTIEQEDANANGYCLPVHDSDDDGHETHNTQ